MSTPKTDGPVAAMLAHLQAHPGAPIADLARAAYGDDGLRSRMAVTSMLGAMLKRGTVYRRARGRYAVRVAAMRQREKALAGA
jgi:hypothetical protein